MYFGCLPFTDSASADAARQDAVDAGPSGPVWINIFHSSDEHGWLQPYQDDSLNLTCGGVANIYASWRELYQFDPEQDLLLSGGDNWSGPAISSWFDGEPSVDAFNLMAYDASAAGNHEFDKGTDLLATRAAQADYPYLSANIIERDSGECPDYLQPWVILTRKGQQVGVLGLTTTSTATSTDPALVANLEFTDPVAALNREVPAMRAAGAQIIVVLAHECEGVVAEQLRAANVKVDVAFAGHCHDLAVAEVDGVPIVSSGSYWRSFGLVNIKYDPALGQVVETAQRVVNVNYPSNQANPVEPDQALLSLVDTWQQRLDEALGQEIAYTVSGIQNRSWTQANFICDADLWAFPLAQVCLQNMGGFRQSLMPGPISKADIVGMMPFDSLVYLVDISGAQLVQNIQIARQQYMPPAIAGLRYTVSGTQLHITMDSGETFDEQASYRVLINSFMYNGGDNFLFGQQDPEPDDQGQNYRQPVIDWCLAHPSSASSPIEASLDSAPRG